MSSGGSLWHTGRDSSHWVFANPLDAWCHWTQDAIEGWTDRNKTHMSLSFSSVLEAYKTTASSKNPCNEKANASSYVICKREFLQNWKSKMFSAFLFLYSHFWAVFPISPWLSVSEEYAFFVLFFSPYGPWSMFCVCSCWITQDLKLAQVSANSSNGITSLRLFSSLLSLCFCCSYRHT